MFYHAAAETQVLSRLRRESLCVMSKTAVKTGREMVKCGIGYANVLKAFDTTIGIIKYRQYLFMKINKQIINILSEVIKGLGNQLQFPESEETQLVDSHTYVATERCRLENMLKKMMQYYNKRNIPYACKTSAGQSVDFDPDEMELQNRAFMTPPESQKRPKKKKKKIDNFIADDEEDDEEDEHDRVTKACKNDGIKDGKRRKQSPDVAAMFDSAAAVDNDGNASSGNSADEEGDDQYEACESENDAHREMDEVSVFKTPDGLSLSWTPWQLPSGNKFKFADTGNDGQFYVCDSPEEKSSLCIHNLLIKKRPRNDKLGRFRERYKIINVYLTEHGKQNLSWLEGLIQDINTKGKIVSGQPAKNGEFDLINIKGIQLVNKARKEALTLHLEYVIEKGEQSPKVTLKFLGALKAELSLVETVHYEYLTPTQCACGCGLPADQHKCTACSDFFFPNCLKKDDNMWNGLCKVCDLVEQAPLSEEVDEESEEEEPSPSSIARTQTPDLTLRKRGEKRPRVVHTSDDDDDLRKRPFSEGLKAKS